MDYRYLICPFLTWLITGSTKFFVNCCREKRMAFDLIGYGGFPSNHASISASICSLIGWQDGISHPAFGVALTFTFIVLLDANSLRRQIGRQATLLNLLAQTSSPNNFPKLRERIGHSKIEIFAGLCIGCLMGALLANI